MHILLAAATAFEIQPTIDALAQGAGREAGPGILITGVGGVAATWSLMRQIGSSRPDVIIQAGIAGSLSGSQRPGEVFVIREDRLADLGVWEGGGSRSVFDLRLAQPDGFPFSNGRLINPYRGLLGLSRLEAVSAMTVNEITTDPLRIDWYQQNTDVVVESMEGGPLHYVGLQEGIPFLQMRSISNAIGVRDKTKWDIPLAIDRLNEQLIFLLEQLPSAGPSIFEKANH